MIRGITTSAAGMLASQNQQEALTNDLANTQTPGFKSTSGQMLEFPQQLLSAMNYSNGTITDKNIGSIGTGVVFQEGVPLFLQGVLTTTKRGLDVALEDTTPSGTYASVGQGNNVKSVNGSVSSNGAGILSVNGTPLAVLNSDGVAIPNVFAMKNPNYQGSGFFAATGKPSYDSNGQPSYVFVNGQNKIIGSPADPAFQSVSIRIGNNTDMGQHSFFAVAYQSLSGNGIALTKDGSFNVNSQNQLVDASGNAVLPVGANGNVLYNARIEINSAYKGQDIFSSTGGPLTDSNGQPSYRVVDTNGNVVNGAKLSSVNVDVTKLSPLGQTEFMVGNTLNPNQVIANLSVGTAQIKPGELEQSNVDTSAILTKMMEVQQLYQSNQEALSVASTTMNDAITKVGVTKI